MSATELEANMQDIAQERLLVQGAIVLANETRDGASVGSDCEIPNRAVGAIAVNIEVFAARPKQFWVTMGPYFARRDVRKEMPYLIDDDSYVWFIAWDGDVMAGFAAAHVVAQFKAVLHSLYVVEAYRKKTVGKQLMEYRLKWATDAGCDLAESVCNAKTKPIYEKAGFAEASKRGSYSVMRKPLT